MKQNVSRYECQHLSVSSDRLTSCFYPIALVYLLPSSPISCIDSQQGVYFSYAPSSTIAKRRGPPVRSDDYEPSATWAWESQEILTRFHGVGVAARRVSPRRDGSQSTEVVRKTIARRLHKCEDRFTSGTRRVFQSED